MLKKRVCCLEAFEDGAADVEDELEAAPVFLDW